MLIKDKKELTTGSKLLLFLLKVGYYHGRLHSMTRIRDAVYSEYSEYIAKRRLNSLVYKYKSKGWIQYEYKEGKRLIKLTKKGQLEALLLKMKFPHKQKSWDEKWRLVIFDIPEHAHLVRDSLRALLKQAEFKALQASVYISPYPLSQEGIEYLKKSKLIKYIRILRVDNVDNPKDLYRSFKIKPKKVKSRKH